MKTPSRYRLVQRSWRVLVGAIWLGSFCVCALAAQDSQLASPRQRLLADFNWRFIHADPAGAEQANFDDSQWRRVNLPHDWSIEGPYDRNAPTGGRGGYLPTGIGWYRRHFIAPESWRGKKVSIEFEGVYMRSDVWINGHHLGRRPFGYISFDYDLTPQLKFGETNVIAVRVDNSQQPNSRWYSGSGIYRHVWVMVTDPLHVAHWGTYVTAPKVSAASATVDVRTRIQNEDPADRLLTLDTEILDAQGRVIATASSQDNIAATSESAFTQSLEVTNPALWSLESPTLYRVRSLVKVGGQTVDKYETPFGIRSIRYDVDKGFFLNGEHVKMRGLCLHHDGGCVGAAVPIDLWERRLRELKAMGCNAIRLSHNPPAPELLDLCDHLGFLVMDEAFDEWKIGKVPHGYSTFFDDWSIRDLTDMLHRDRNHPSVVLWSVGNEIREQTRPNGAEALRPLVETCHREDPTRPVTSACDNVFTDHGGATLDFLNLLDIVGYNYVDRWGKRRETYYADDRHQFPQRKMVGTESVIVRDTRGEYDFRPFGPDQTERAVYATSMIRAEQLWKFVAMHDYVIGDFLWTGIDYLGESFWPRKLAASGVLDTCGFPKDNYYFYQSQWTTKPVLHLFPHWNWEGHEGQIIPVIAYTSCDTVELFLNGKSYGVKAYEFPRQGASGGWNRYAKPRVSMTTADLHLSWDVPYSPGVLKAVGYQEGRKVCEDEVQTTGAPAAIVLSADRTTLRANAQDVAQITVKAVDSRGRMVPTADNLVKFDVQGAGKLIGVDNGDPASHESYQAPQRKAFNGLCLAVVQTGHQAGRIHVAAQGEGLQSASIDLAVEPPATVIPTLP